MNYDGSTAGSLYRIGQNPCLTTFILIGAATKPAGHSIPFPGPNLMANIQIPLKQ